MNAMAWLKRASGLDGINGVDALILRAYSENGRGSFGFRTEKTQAHSLAARGF
jgi:hypothetical protein